MVHILPKTGYDPIHAVSILVSEMPVSALQKSIDNSNRKRQSSSIERFFNVPDKSQKICALDTAEFKGPRYEGSPGIPL